MSKAHSGFVNGSGVQAHSAGDIYPATIVVVGGIPSPEDSFNHYQVWHGGEKYGPFWTHKCAETYARHLIEKGEGFAARQFGFNCCLTDDRERIEMWDRR